MASVVVGFGCMALELAARGSTVHPKLTRHLGFSAHAVDARRCGSATELAELVAASSAIPPFMPVGRLGGEPLLDGGLVDNAPATTAEQVGGIRRTLILLTETGFGWTSAEDGTRLYVAPSSTPPVGMLDCTRPEQLERTIALGDADAERYEPRLRRFLLSSPSNVRERTPSRARTRTFSRIP